MKPLETLKIMDKYLSELQKAKKMTVAVGLPQETINSRNYESGENVATVGMQHEYGAGVPQRSWLRMPLEMKRNDLARFIQDEYNQVLMAKSATATALDRVGAMATAQIKQAFATNGFGQWQPLSAETQEFKDAHGRNQTLVFTGLLRNSVGWKVRNVT